MNGGEKGRQLGMLTAGVYRINTALFTVITVGNAAEHWHDPGGSCAAARRAGHGRHRHHARRRARFDDGEIAGPMVPGHDNFQNAQAFLDAGGRRGLQEQILLSGPWNLNPWFAQVEQVPMVEIPIGHVGVVISFVGQAHEDVSGTDFKHGDLVDVGHKGVWVTPLYPGKHPLNTRVMNVELVPTTNIVLNWANRTEAHHLRRQTLVDHRALAGRLRLQPRCVADHPHRRPRGAQGHQPRRLTAEPRRPRPAADRRQLLPQLARRTTPCSTSSAPAASARPRPPQHIEAALREYDVEAIDTLIGDITAAGDADENADRPQDRRGTAKTYEMQEAAEKQRQQLVRQTSLADIQHQVVGAEQGVKIAELQATAVRKSQGEAESITLRATGEADAIRATGDAKAEAYRAGVEALGGATTP